MAGEYKKIVIVTGGSSGIGRCTASALRDSGCIVYEFSRRNIPMEGITHLSVHVFVEDGITIVNFPTKDKWRDSSELSYIESGLDAFIKVLPELNVTTVAIPPLGCGNGGLKWGNVKAVIEEKLKQVSEKYTFLLYEPNQNYVQKAKEAPKLTVSSLILMQLKIGSNTG